MMLSLMPFPGGGSFRRGIRLVSGGAPADGVRAVGDGVHDDGPHNQCDAREQQHTDCPAG